MRKSLGFTSAGRPIFFFIPFRVFYFFGAALLLRGGGPRFATTQLRGVAKKSSHPRISLPLKTLWLGNFLIRFTSLNSRVCFADSFMHLIIMKVEHRNILILIRNSTVKVNPNDFRIGFTFGFFSNFEPHIYIIL